MLGCLTWLSLPKLRCPLVRRSRNWRSLSLASCNLCTCLRRAVSCQILTRSSRCCSAGDRLSSRFVGASLRPLAVSSTPNPAMSEGMFGGRRCVVGMTHHASALSHVYMCACLCRQRKPRVRSSQLFQLLRGGVVMNPTSSQHLGVCRAQFPLRPACFHLTWTRTLPPPSSLPQLASSHVSCAPKPALVC